MKPSFQESEHCKGYAHDHIQFVEALCEENKTELDFEKRLKHASQKTGVAIELIHDEKIKQLIFNYLAFYKYDGPYHLLFSKMIVLWRVHAKMMEDFEDAGEMSKLNSLADTLQDQTTELIRKIFGEQFGDAAQQQIRKALTPEQRLKQRSQQ